MGTAWFPYLSTSWTSLSNVGGTTVTLSPWVSVEKPENQVMPLAGWQGWKQRRAFGLQLQGFSACWLDLYFSSS